MKNLVFIYLAIIVIFTACEKEEVTTISTNSTYDFSCNVGGVDFTDNSPIVVVDPSSNVLTIDALNLGSSIRIIIYNFSDRNVDEEISLNNLTDKAYVTKDGVDYTNTQSGKLIFTKIDAKLSGTFNFISESSAFSSKSVTEGVFDDLAY